MKTTSSLISIVVVFAASIFVDPDRDRRAAHLLPSACRFKGVVRFLMLDIAVLALLLGSPAIALIIPSSMG